MRINSKISKLTYLILPLVSCVALFSIGYGAWVIIESDNISKDVNVDVNVGNTSSFNDFVKYDESKGYHGVNVFGLNDEGFVNEDGFSLTNGIINCYYILQSEYIRNYYNKDVDLFKQFKLQVCFTQGSNCKNKVINETYLKNNFLKIFYSNKFH